MEGLTRRSPGPHLRTFLIVRCSLRPLLVCQAQPFSFASDATKVPAGLRIALLGRLHERALELPYVVALQEEAEPGVDRAVPGVVCDDAMGQRAGELVRLPLGEGP